MNKDFVCPKCGSSDLMYNKTKDFYICEDCDNRFKPEGRPEHLKIFLSYGHDRFVSEALIIKEDLEERGHEIWFDLEKIIEGRDWEKYIEDGLRWCDKVLLLMTPYSVRRRDFDDPESTDGYCLNEIAKALEKNKLIIPVLLVEVEDGAPTSICRIQYMDMRDAIPINENEDKYITYFDRLVRAIEHNDIDFEGGQIRLKRYLKPLKFESEIGEHISRFSGREWLIDEINRWLVGEASSSVFWLVGEPGIGKTAVSSYLSHNHGRLIAYHFCVYGHEDKSNPQRAILSIAYYIAQHISEYDEKLQDLEIEKEILKKPQTIFDNIIVQPLKDIKLPRKNFFILIDALDEATKDDGTNHIAEFIRDQWSRTPSWLKLMITSRPEPNLMTTLSDLNPRVLNAKSEDNFKDLRNFLDYELKKRNLEADATVTEKMISKSEGLFLYLEKIMEEIDAERLSLDDVDKFPQGLSSIYLKFFKRQFNDIAYRKSISPALEIVLASREPLKLKDIASILNWSDYELFTLKNSLSSFIKLKFEEDEDSKNENPHDKWKHNKIQLFHKSLADWLTNPEIAYNFFISRVDAHRKLANFLLEEINLYKDNETVEEVKWSFSELLYQLRMAGMWEELISCLENPDIFNHIPPTAYGLNSYGFGSDIVKPKIDIRRDSDPLEPNSILNIPLKNRSDIGFAIADVFATQTRNLIHKRNTFAKPWPRTASRLWKSDPEGFINYRDTFYFSAKMAAKTAEFAIVAFDGTANSHEKLEKFMEKNSGLSSWLHYLMHFGRDETGLSGALEDIIAYDGYKTWEKLHDLFSKTKKNNSFR